MENQLELGGLEQSAQEFAEKAYISYAVAVVKGRALPYGGDGLKPVQRRILYSMSELRLSSIAKPVKSARVVGDVIGKLHPHGDVAVYDAMVRVAQDFSLRYPLCEGIGNFGSRDGDGAAAMRYTEIRLSAISELLLSEIDRGTVDFRPNYDGVFQEPVILPARLPFVLLNGASGIAVGMATEIPSHNILEVADAAIHMIQHPDATLDDVMKILPGPDYPGGARIISPQADIRSAYESGRGSLKVRAAYEFEDLARGQWQLVVTELPPAVSSQKVLEEIEDLTNPKVKTGKKTLTPEQQQTKTLALSMLERVRDESGKQASIRLVFEPKSRSIDRDAFVSMLLAQTSLQFSAPINMTMVGNDGRPCQKGLLSVLTEWCDFRLVVVRRRTEFRLGEVDRRIHILEGRRAVLLHIDEVIAIIRGSDDPKVDLMAQFGLSEIQADDILEIRLRQLARLEVVRLEAELKQLSSERDDLRALLESPVRMRNLIVREIKEDAKKFGDKRRTRIEEATALKLNAPVLSEPMTFILSEKGWVRGRSSHSVDMAQINFKEGDKLQVAMPCRTDDTLTILLSDGRSYSLAANLAPTGRGDGAPLSSLIEMPPKTHVVAVIPSYAPTKKLIFASRDGYGFISELGNLASSRKAGKVFAKPEAELLAPIELPDNYQHLLLAVGTSKAKILIFPLEQLKELPGGKGTILAGMDDDEMITCLATSAGSFQLEGQYKSRPKTINLKGAELEALTSQRARKAKQVQLDSASPYTIKEA